MDFPLYLQQNDNDCGLACLIMISKYYKIKNLKHSKFRTECKTKKNENFSVLNITKIAESLGFKVEVFQINISGLVSLKKLPAILYWNQNHFIVLYKIQENKFFIADPAMGYKIYNLKDFLRHWVIKETENINVGIVILFDL